jgi:ABC-type glutathione transport system ATPase component
VSESEFTVAPGPSASPDSNAIVEAVALRKVFDATVAVADASFSIQPGRSLAIVGESGSGKTTIAKILAGLERATSGTVRVCGRDRTRAATGTRERRRRGGELQIVFQDPYSSLDPRQRVGDCIAEAMRVHRPLSKKECESHTRELAELVGLDGRQLRAYPTALSGGQRQRVAIARALASEPKVIVMDEAVASLDVSVQAQVLNTIADVRERTGATIVFISHDLAVVRQVTDDVIVMRSGEIVESGTTAEVLDAPQHPYTRLLRASVPTAGWKPPAVGQTPKL